MQILGSRGRIRLVLRSISLLDQRLLKHLFHRYHCKDPDTMVKHIPTGSLTTHIHSYCQYWDQKWSIEARDLRDYVCECESAFLKRNYQSFKRLKYIV